MQEILNFLDDLKANNNREWFAANKQRYDILKAEFDTFTADLIHAFGKTDTSLAYLEPKDCTYRIYRDTRFAADKTPYKTNIGAYLVKGGKKSGKAGYYFHLEPGSTMVAGGLYMPMPDVLKKVREDIYENSEVFDGILKTPAFVSNFGTLDADAKLKNPPRDYPKDFAHIEYLKYKSYTASKILPSATLQRKQLLNTVVENFAALQPFIKFLNEALEQ